MAAAAGGALEAPSLLPAIIGLMALLGCFVCMGLRYGWIHTFGWLLEKLADALHFKILGHGIDFGGPIRYANAVVLNQLEGMAEGFQASAGYFLHAAAYLFAWGLGETAHLAEETLHFGRWLTHIHLPRYVRWAVTALVPPLLIARLAGLVQRYVMPRVAKLIAGAAHDTRVVVERLPIALGRELARDERAIAHLQAQVGAIAGHVPVALPHSYPTPWKLWRGLTRRAARIERRLGRLESLLGVAGFAAIMAKTLGLPDWRCLTRGNVGRLSRALCGLDKALVDLFLLGTAEVMIASDLCSFAQAMTAAAKTAEPLLMDFVNVEQALIHCPSASYPEKLAVPALDLAAPSPVVNL